MLSRSNKAISVLAVLGLVLLTTPLSIPFLSRADLIPGGIYQLVVVPFISMVGFVYITFSCWQYVLNSRELSPTTPRGLGIGVLIVTVLGAVVASIWSLSSIIPPVRIFVEDPWLNLPPITLLIWFPAGKMLGAEELQLGGILFSIPLAIIGISTLLVGVIGVWMVGYVLICAISGLPILIFGFLVTPKQYNNHVGSSQ
ncbi:hypothetical protein [Haloparvum sp. AD34]